ncbi:ATP-binding protein [Archaeoglobus neptunius]|uniref:ATP-binding protein n=1 Tax=Archaeoglobus neptunius TaxID=2798580 RepID=UPI001926164B|nr:ATP-binding protein [Archaeoglobus neptunius]
MKCRKCGRRAVAILKAYGLSLCERCYPEFYLNLVKRSIKRYGILKPKEKILAAVSGGKDSSAMANVLKKLGYEFELLYIDLGIDHYSSESERAVMELAESIDVNVNVVRLEEYGFTVSDVRKRLRRKTCSACGTAKRYIMNRFARENGFDIITTGHTVEDIVSFYLKNVAGGMRLWAEKLLPRNEPFDEKIVARAKPLFEVSEKENMLYVLIESIPFTPMECPYAPNPEWKEIVYEIERRKPGFSKNFIRGLISEKEEFDHVKYCRLCGEITNRDICSFCKLRMSF